MMFSMYYMSENELKEYFVIISIFLLKDYTKHSSSSVTCSILPHRSSK